MQKRSSQTGRTSMFLLEIGTEEIPARFVLKGLGILRESLVQLLQKECIGHGSIREYATPRRLAVCIENVADMQEDRTNEVIGPPAKIAFDANGAPTKAASGFARSLNVSVEKLTIKATERGEYASVLVEEKGKASIDVLSAKLPDLISTLQLPRTMRWGSGSLRFFRPIQWIVALLGGEVVPFGLDGIKSGRCTHGHRFLSSGTIDINDPAEYLSLLRSGHVIADHEERKRIIADELRQIGTGLDLTVHEDNELLDTVTFLVEYPTLVQGRFEDKYIELPKELLITVMRTHQKYFSTEDRNGAILPYFIVTSNSSRDNSTIVRKGAERVLRARLEDARFYYTEDQKLSLSEYREKLRDVTFQEKLGSMYDKTERVKNVCSSLAGRLGFPSGEKLLQAALLSKADLVTGIVREFPELQGYMGMIYALNSGVDRDIAAAIHEHYQPKFPGDALPDGEIGTIVSLADKIDNIVSFFHLGLIPSGSEDPFALRRQAAGIITILQGRDHPLLLSDLTRMALQNFPVPQDEKVGLTLRIMQFFQQRLEGILLTQGYGHDVISAVLSVDEMTIRDLKQKIEALTELKKNPRFPGLLTAAKRVYNILSRAKRCTVDPSLLSEPSEKELYDHAVRIREKITGDDITLLLELEGPVNSFFDNVLVMDKDERIRDNRLSLLFIARDLFSLYGDLSKIVD